MKVVCGVGEGDEREWKKWMWMKKVVMWIKEINVEKREECEEIYECEWGRWVWEYLYRKRKKEILCEKFYHL